MDTVALLGALLKDIGCFVPVKIVAHDDNDRAANMPQTLKNFFIELFILKINKAQMYKAGFVILWKYFT
jgi:hypothetical protein